MKKILILFMMLCVILSAMAAISCGGGNDTDTGSDTIVDTNSESDTDTSVDTDTDKVVEVTYTVTVKDQDGIVIKNAMIHILDENDQPVDTLSVDENGQLAITIPQNVVYFVKVAELPEGYLNVAGKVKLENEDTVLVVENNIPDGTHDRPYPTEDLNEIKLGANESVYYISYGGGRNLLIENAQGLKLTYGSDEPIEADEENKISFKMPVSEDLYDRATIMKLENTLSEEKTFVLKIYSDKGELDNPYDIALDENNEITVVKGATVYYKYVAQKSGMVVVYSETENNNIYCYNTTTFVTSEYTNGRVCEYIYASEGDEVMIYVSSNATSNYNTVEFKLSHYDGTSEEPIPLYKDSTSFKLAPSQSLAFVVNAEAKSSLSVSGPSYKLTVGENEYTEEDTYEILIEGEKTFTVANTDAFDGQRVEIVIDPLNEPTQE